MVCAAQELAGETVTSLHALHESLELPDGYRAEIIDGSITVSPTPSFRHAEVVTILQEVLIKAELTGLRTLQVVTVEIGETGDRYVPDLVVMPTSAVSGDDGKGSGWIRPAEEIELAVEVVSPSSALHDWQAKAQGYARAGVPLYLVVDPRRSEIALFSQPTKGQYQDVARAVRGASVKLPEPFGIEIEATPLLT